MGATRKEFMKAHPTAQQVGRTFPIFLVNKLEFSFPRANSLEEEVKARDLTVNAMLLDEDGNLICHPKSLEDLHAKILRPTSQQAFVDDPLRVFRAARFWAKFPDFTPHEELIECMRDVSAHGYLNTLPADRIGQETIKALNAPVPGNYLRLLAKADCLAPWFTEFKGGLEIPAGPLPYHDTNVIEHTCRTMDALAGTPNAVWMGFCHDLGKMVTPESKYPRHFGHDRAGILMAETVARRIRLSNAYVTAGLKATKWHMVAARYDELRPGTKVDLLMDLHLAKLVEPFFKLVQADQDKDFIQEVRRDLRAMLPVSLPKEFTNLGPESGQRLRTLRAQALRDRHKK